MKKRDQRLSKKIIEIYEKNIFWLPVYKMGHFFTRAYKISGNKKYENFLALYIFVTKSKSLDRALRTLEKNKFNYIREKSAKTKSERKITRELLYKHNPKIPFYNALLNDLFFLEKFGLLRTLFKKEFRALLPFLKKEDFKKIYLQEEVIRKDSSFAFNSLFYLNYFGISCLKEQAEKTLKKIYFNKDMQLKAPLKKADYCSLIYSLTHIIISESQYYEKHVTNHAWIIKYFNDNLETILQNVTQDILAEVGLCFRLHKKETIYSVSFQKILSQLSGSLKLQRLEEDIFYFNKKEHTSSIFILLFGDFKNFFSGPNLLKIYQKNFLKN